MPTVLLYSLNYILIRSVNWGGRNDCGKMFIYYSYKIKKEEERIRIP